MTNPDSSAPQRDPAAIAPLPWNRAVRRPPATGVPAGRGPFRVLIVGGGFSGAATAMHLAHRAKRPVRIVLFDPGPRPGRGVAYGEGPADFLLNVPAGRLTADPDRPGDFHRWAVASGLASAPDAFLPRAWFGAYAGERLEQAVADNPLVELVHERDAVTGVSVDDGAVRVTTAKGEAFSGDHAVLALGHGPLRVPGTLAGLRSDPRLLDGPWNRETLVRLAEKAERILLVGTGLTMVDAVIGLERAGFRGDLVAVSRRGTLARSHGPKDDAAHAAWASALRGLTLPELTRAIRERCEAGDWRGVIDSLRPHTQGVWRTLNGRDRARFLARLAVYWDAHRHRAPPAVHAEVESLRAAGRLRVVAGGLESARVIGERIAVRLRPWNAGETTVYADGVVLCTGPEPDPGRWGSSLVDGLLRDGLAIPDGLGLGLRTDARGFLLGADGGAGEGLLSTLGPLRRGDLWESTAVPEIARQAAGLAAAVLDAAPALIRTSPSGVRGGPALVPRADGLG